MLGTRKPLRDGVLKPGKERGLKTRLGNFGIVALSLTGCRVPRRRLAIHAQTYVCEELLFMFLAGNRLGTVSLSQEKNRCKKTLVGNLGIVALWTCGSTRDDLKCVCSETRFV